MRWHWLEVLIIIYFMTSSSIDVRIFHETKSIWNRSSLISDIDIGSESYNLSKKDMNIHLDLNSITNGKITINISNQIFIILQF